MGLATAGKGPSCFRYSCDWNVAHHADIYLADVATDAILTAYRKTLVAAAESWIISPALLAVALSNRLVLSADLTYLRAKLSFASKSAVWPVLFSAEIGRAHV